MARKKEVETEFRRYHGVASAHGLEILMPFDDKLVPYLVIRASLYRFRHSVYFEVKLDGLTVTVLDNLLQRKQNADALRILKQKARELHIPRELASSWDMLPDERLDCFLNYDMATG